MKMKFFNLIKSTSRFWNQFSYVLGIFLILSLSVGALLEDSLIDSMVLIIAAVCVLGVSIIEFKSFINKGVHWQEVYDKSCHKKIWRLLNLFVVIGLGSGIVYIGRNPFVEVTLNGITIPSSFWLNILLGLFSLIIILTIVNFILTIVNRCLDKISQRLDRKLLEVEDDE